MERVSSWRRSSVGEVGGVELEQIAGSVGNDDGGHLGPPERGLDLLGGRCPDNDRRTGLKRLAKLLVVVDVVEDECLRDVELALDRDLRDAAPRCPEPALPHTVTDSPGWTRSIATSVDASRSSSSGVPLGTG